MNNFIHGERHPFHKIEESSEDGDRFRKRLWKLEPPRNQTGQGRFKKFTVEYFFKQQAKRMFVEVSDVNIFVRTRRVNIQTEVFSIGYADNEHSSFFQHGENLRNGDIKMQHVL